MKKRGMLYGAISLLCVAPIACTTEPVVCTADFRYGLNVTVVQAADGAPVVEGLAGTATEDDYSEDLMDGGGYLYGAGERPGVYDLTVTADGFEAWDTTGVRVSSDECHVDPVRFTVEMTPSG